MILTFLVLGILLWGIFWAVMWFLNVTGIMLIAGTFAFVGVMILVQWAIGPVLLKALVKMRECTDENINKMVHELADQAKIPRPKVYIADNPTPNAFAFGRTQKSSAIALHTGLLEKLSHEEVRGVIAHEIGHIKHRDVLVMTLASALPVILYYIVFFGLMMAGSRDREGGGMNYFGAMIGGMVAQFIASLLVLYLSRVREYYADDYSAHTTKKPMALANALGKITYSLAGARPRAVPANLRTFYIADPSMAAGMEAEKRKGFMEVFLTHPLTYKRITALEKIEKEMKAGS
jgi:heat shock protein HtpX